MTGPGSSGQRGIAALLALTSAMTTLDAYSTLNSSPWTVENVGADPKKAQSARECYRHAVVFSMGYAVVAGILAGPALMWFAIAGAGVANVYLIWMYERAIGRAQASGSDGSGWFK